VCVCVRGVCVDRCVRVRACACVEVRCVCMLVCVCVCMLVWVGNCLWVLYLQMYFYLHMAFI
jgi:hypothetical protein